MATGNHATDHRSQIATLLTQQGITPPGLDAWDYNVYCASGRCEQPGIG